jgi:hypothetical protein
MSISVTPIPRLTTLVTPAFTLGTTNTAGSAITAVASDSTILTYDATVPETVGTANAAGDSTTAARRNHVHAALGTRTTILNGSRTASAGAGDQSLTGAGFTPKGVVAIGLDNGTSVGSWGLGDDAVGETVIVQKSDGNMTYNTTFLIYGLDSSNGLYAVIKTLDSDGLTLTWAKDGSGTDVNFSLLLFA